MVKKAFLVTFVGNGTGRQTRELLSLPADDKIFPVKDATGKTNMANARTLSERILKRMYPRSRDTIRIVKIEPHGRDSAEDIMTDKIKAIAKKYNRDDSSSIAFNERMHRIKRYNPDKDERGYEKVNAYITSANNKLGSNVHIISDMKYKGIPRFSIRVLGSHEYKTIAEAKAIISKIQEAIELVKNAPKPALKG